MIFYSEVKYKNTLLQKINYFYWYQDNKEEVKYNRNDGRKYNNDRPIQICNNPVFKDDII